MLSYEHIYHAGNHADVLKHIVFTLILEHLKKKEAPFTVIDSHAGSGIYNLDDERAQKTAERESGLARLLPIISDADFTWQYKKAIAFIAPYTEICTRYKSEHLYPGSPEIARCMLRKEDELILCELHPRAIEELRANMDQNSLLRDASLRSFGTNTYIKPHIHHRSGFELLSSLHPPRRGLVLMDPSYEELSDFSNAADSLNSINCRWKGGILALWYPLTVSKGLPCSRMRQAIISGVQSRESEPRILDLQLTVKSQDSLQGNAMLYGSGMMIINYPYQLDTQMESILPLLNTALAAKNGTISLMRY